MGSLYLFLIDINMKSLITLSLVVLAPSCLFNFTLLPSKDQLRLQNQFVDKFPRKSVTKFQRLLMSPSLRSNVAMFPTPFVLMSKSANVRSLRDLYKSLSPGSSVDSNTGRTVRLRKTPGSSAATFRMSNVTMFQS